MRPIERGKEKLFDRPIVPSLNQWLGDGARADGFEEFVRNSELIEATACTPGEAQAARLMRTFSIACVEALRIERERYPELPPADAVLRLARVAGSAVFGAVISASDYEDPAAPLLKLAKHLAEEFAHGARIMARAQLRADGDA